MYDPKQKVLFVHIAKTGGSSVSNYYGECRANIKSSTTVQFWEEYLNYHLYKNIENDPHIWIRGYETFLNLDDYFKFTIFRDPAEYVQSSFYEWPHAYNSKNFDEFILSEEFIDIIDKQYDHIIDSEGKERIDKFFKFEKLYQVFIFISHRIFNQLPHQIPHLQRTNRLPEKLTSEVKQKIYKEFSQDYEYWKSL